MIFVALAVVLAVGLALGYRIFRSPLTGIAMLMIVVAALSLASLMLHWTQVALAEPEVEEKTVALASTSANGTAFLTTSSGSWGGDSKVQFFAETADGSFEAVSAWAKNTKLVTDEGTTPSVTIRALHYPAGLYFPWETKGAEEYVLHLPTPENPSARELLHKE